jgi:uncharacterized heparinase superfamily protein
MLGFLRSPAISDPELGSIERSRGRWRGKLALGGQSIPLALIGARSAPNADALALAKALPAAWSRNLEAVAQALVDHLAPYQEAIAAGELEPPSPPLPAIARPSDVWRFVTLQSASVTSIDGKLVSEVALSAAWDEEHTLGARFEGARFVELNGSILPD